VKLPSSVRAHLGPALLVALALTVLIAGVWSQTEVGLWGAVEFIPDIVTLAGRGQVKINTWHMADGITRHPEAYCICAGAKPA